MRQTTRSIICGTIIALMIGWAVWSYEAGGLVYVLAADPPSGESRLQVLREYVLAWGALAPLAYIGTVTIEVLVAPIPGTLLYAPAGAIFGGLLGGALSLVGNVIGAGIATLLARTFGAQWFARRRSGSRVAHYCQLLAARGAWVVFLLRINPLTSSDLVSYAAGLAGVRPSRVAIGTFFGMAPHCFLQAYLAATIFESLSPVWLAILAIAAAAIFTAVVFWRGREPGTPGTPGTSLASGTSGTPAVSQAVRRTSDTAKPAT